MKNLKTLALTIMLLASVNAFAQSKSAQTSNNFSARNSGSQVKNRTAQPRPATKKIEWYSNLYAAYKEALRQNKPLVVYFYVWNGNNCRRLENEVLSSAEVNSLADKAVFARADVETDDSYKNIATLIGSLNLKEYPVVTVLDAAPDRLVERGKIIGYFDTPQFYFHLSQLFLKKSR